MITWMQLWWELLIPLLMVAVLSVALPTIHITGRVSGGGPIREWFLNHCLLPLLSDHDAQALVVWWMKANEWQEIALVLFIGLNINVVLLPLLWAQGEAWIRLKSWFARRSLEDRRRLIR